MRHVIISFVFLFFLKAFAQNTNVVLSHVPIGTEYKNEGISIKFLKVISDSRCPKDVTCVRAGEAKILVAVYSNGKFLQNKQLIIDASGFISKSNNNAFVNDDFSIDVIGLLPYPEGTNKIPDEAYYLEVVTNLKQ